jgi:hypothetical protein
MSNNLPQQPSTKQVKSHLDIAAMREAVLEQVQKDLDYELDDIDCTKREFFETLLEKLKVYFTNIIDNQPNRLAQIIYRVDINEVKLKRLLADQQASSAGLIAKLTLERIMLKVFYRNVYNGNIQL